MIAFKTHQAIHRPFDKRVECAKISKGIQMLSHTVMILLHVISVLSGVMAAVLWWRSADIDIPDMAPTRHHKNKEGSLSTEWIDQFAINLKDHRKQWLKSTRFNKAAASSAAIAAMAQAVVYSINLINLLI